MANYLLTPAWMAKELAYRRMKAGYPPAAKIRVMIHDYCAYQHSAYLEPFTEQDAEKFTLTLPWHTFNKLSAMSDVDITVRFIRRFMRCVSPT